MSEQFNPCELCEARECVDNKCGLKNITKQLKQENEKLKQECDLYKTWYRAKHDDLKNFLGKLKTENEDLETKIQEMYKMGSENFVAIDQAKRLYKLNNCLDEIEEIAQDKVNACCSMRNIDCDFSCNKCLFKTLDKVLQKIKEVKDNE